MMEECVLCGEPFEPSDEESWLDHWVECANGLDTLPCLEDMEDWF